MRRTVLRPVAGITIGAALTVAGLFAGVFLFVLLSRIVAGIVLAPPELFLLSWAGLLLVALLGGGLGMAAGYRLYGRVLPSR